MTNEPVLIRHLGRQPYEPVWRAMQQHALERTTDTRDEIWCLEHDPVYTLGLNADRAHLLRPGETPVIPVDRGGQVTYHGPGQLVVYPLLDMKRRGLGVRPLVTALENAVIDLLADLGIASSARREAPGVYVRGAKIASIGLRIRRGGSYHGLAFNLDLDLEPFTRINPCGMQGLEVTRLADLCPGFVPGEAAAGLLRCLLRRLGADGETADPAPSPAPRRGSTPVGGEQPGDRARI